MKAPREAPVDRRPEMRAADVLEQLTAAVRALSVPQGVRLPDAGAGYPAMRTFFHSLSDAQRRALLLRLLTEEGARITTDRGADL